jgi:ABC-2 type transport system ATP-binding protein
VLFLDEPTTGLDVRIRQEMWQVISDLVVSGVTVFLTTQQLEEADHMADRIAVIDLGHIVAEGTSAQLKEQVGGHRLDLTLIDASAFAEVVSRLGPRVAHSDASRLTVGIVTDGNAAHVRALLDDIDPQRRAIRSFTTHSATIDDVFLALTGQTIRPREEETANV